MQTSTTPKGFPEGGSSSYTHTKPYTHPHTHTYYAHTYARHIEEREESVSQPSPLQCVPQPPVTLAIRYWCASFSSVSKCRLGSILRRRLSQSPTLSSICNPLGLQTGLKITNNSNKIKKIKFYQVPTFLPCARTGLFTPLPVRAAVATCVVRIGPGLALFDGAFFKFWCPFSKPCN